MLANVTFGTKSHPLHGLSSGAVVDMALYSAGMWELTNLRTTLFATIIEETSFLDDRNYQYWYSSSTPRSSPSIDEFQLRKVILAYEFILFAPTEYLTRATRQSLVQRAMVADVIVCRRFDQSDAPAPPSLDVLRVFLKRYLSFQDSLDHEVS